MPTLAFIHTPPGFLMDEIKRYCAQIANARALADHITAYTWLRRSEPFCVVRARMAEHGFSLLDVAALLAGDPQSEPLVALCQDLLEMEIERQQRS